MLSVFLPSSSNVQLFVFTDYFGFNELFDALKAVSHHDWQLSAGEVHGWDAAAPSSNYYTVQTLIGVSSTRWWHSYPLYLFHSLRCVSTLFSSLLAAVWVSVCTMGNLFWRRCDRKDAAPSSGWYAAVIRLLSTMRGCPTALASDIHFLLCRQIFYKKTQKGSPRNGSHSCFL